MNLLNKVAMVTGGGRNLGRCIALRLAQEGADVVINGPEAEELESVAREIQALERRCLHVVADVRREDQVQALADRALAVFRHIDILVNNAGIIGPTCLVSQIKLADWDDVLAVNLTGAFLCCKAVVPAMMARKAGKIVNISSIAGTQAYSLRSPYVASKWGLVGFSATLAKELGEFNIQVNAICPGPLAGERIKQVIQQRAAQLGQTEEVVLHTYLQAAALKRMTQPEDVAAMAAFLAGPTGDNITGQAIEVAAGYGL